MEAYLGVCGRHFHRKSRGQGSNFGMVKHSKLKLAKILISVSGWNCIVHCNNQTLGSLHFIAIMHCVLILATGYHNQFFLTHVAVYSTGQRKGNLATQRLRSVRGISRGSPLITMFYAWATPATLRHNDICLHVA